MAISAPMRELHGLHLHELFTRGRPLLSQPAQDCCDELLG